MWCPLRKILATPLREKCPLTPWPWLRYMYRFKHSVQKVLFCLTRNSRFHLGKDCWNWCYSYGDISDCINYGNVKYCPVKMMPNYQLVQNILNWEGGEGEGVPVFEHCSWEDLACALKIFIVSFKITNSGKMNRGILRVCSQLDYWQMNLSIWIWLHSTSSSTLTPVGNRP